MSEINRVTLKSFDSHKVDDKNEKESTKTLRIALILNESNEDTCPEFDYKEELAAAKKKDKTRENKNGLSFMDPFFDNDDDDVRRIAQQMEAKYGATVPSKKKRKGRKDDYADIGAGYDESDSFIDNTDGYDEMIPQNVTTLHGGFYINSGALEFKTDDEASSDASSSSSSDDDEVENNHNASRKRKIISSDESEGETETENPETSNIHKKPKLMDVNNGKLSNKKNLNNKFDIKRIKKHKSDDKKKSSTVKDLLMEEVKDLNVSLSASFLDSTIVDNENDKKENKKPMSLDNVNDAIESVIKCSKVLPGKVVVKEEMNNFVAPVNTDNNNINNNNNNNNNHNNNVNNDNDNVINLINTDDIKQEIILHSDEMDNSSNDAPKLEAEIVKLPENLPNDILMLIENIKIEAAKLNEEKQKLFSGLVNSKLLILERKFKCLGKQSRMRVYEHLAPFLKCRKETIMKRAKNLVLIDDKKKITELLANLRDCIENIMPPLLDNYTSESQKVMQKKFSKEALDNEDFKHLRMPKRRFTWSEQIKKLFKEIVILRKRCFILEGKNKSNIESQMENFIKAEVQILWPEGWMTMSALLKLYNNYTEANKQSKSTHDKSQTIETSQTNNSTSNHSSSINNNATPINNACSKDMQMITSNSTLSIIPVGTSNINKTSPDINNVKNEIVIDKKVLTTECSSSGSGSGSKIRKPLPIDIITNKASNSLTITPTSSTNVQCVSNVQKHDERKCAEVTKKSIINEVIIVDEKQKKSVIESTNSDTCKKLENKHCQIIDLTENSDARRKSGTKSKTKYHENDDNNSSGKSSKHVDNNSSGKSSKHADKTKNDNKDMTASSAYNSIIQESLSEINIYPQNLKGTSSSNSTSSSLNKLTDHSIKKLSTPSNYANAVDHMKFKGNNEGDDIQRVMEGLKALQNMSSPAKTETSSPVSVISFNKSHNKQNNYNSQTASYSKSDFNSGFQEVFQRQLLNDCSLLKSSPVAFKNHYSNNIDKYTHGNNVGYSSGYSNNNYSQQNNKINPAHQSGSYNALDDMLSNFLSDYGYSKSANHKQKSTHTHK